VLDQPEIHAFSVFDHRKWPPHKPMPLLLEEYGVPEVSLLLKQYHEFFEDTNLEEVLGQWAKLKREISKSSGLFVMKFVDLWPRMLTHFGDISDGYNFILRLVVMMLLMPIDTSICERIFSLMNNIKTSERSTMGQGVLRNLMLWHSLAGDVSMAEVPWISILKEFKLLSKDKPRHKHREFVNPTMATTYADPAAAGPSSAAGPTAPAPPAAAPATAPAAAAGPSESDAERRASGFDANGFPR